MQFPDPFGRRREQVVPPREVVGRGAGGQPRALVDRLAAALRNAAAGPGRRPDTAATLRSFERSRSRKASVVSRQAGTEDYNRYGAVLSRFLPAPLASRYYTRWLRQISTYLDPAAN